VRALAAAVAVGVVNALVFVAFEWIVNDGTDWVWNDLVDSDAVRWRVVPLAIAGSIVLSAVIRLTRQKRIVPASTDPLAGGPAASVPVVLLIGAVSLLAGASLGPEASLFAAATGIGAWLAKEKRLVLASVGALLVAFFGSLLAVAVPLAPPARGPAPARTGRADRGRGAGGVRDAAPVRVRRLREGARLDGSARA
jgi:hypothetical protein